MWYGIGINLPTENAESFIPIQVAQLAPFCFWGVRMSDGSLIAIMGAMTELSVEQQLALVVADRPFIARESVAMYMAMVYGRKPADVTTLRLELMKGTLP